MGRVLRVLALPKVLLGRRVSQHLPQCLRATVTPTSVNEQAVLLLIDNSATLPTLFKARFFSPREFWSHVLGL